MTLPPLTPRRRPTPRADVTYNVDLANRALPLVRRIAEDLARDYVVWRERVKSIELATAGSRGDAPDDDTRVLQRGAKQLAGDIQGYLAELAQLGLECKALDTGLIDFPAELEGEPVFLCWKLGEPSVAWYHRRDAGFAGRQPIPGVEPEASTTAAAAPEEPR